MVARQSSIRDGTGLGVQISGLGLWTPGFAGVEAWRRGVTDVSVVRPAAGLIPPRQRRRASVLTRALATALGEAASQAGVDLATTATVFGSAYGEATTLGYLLGQLHEADGALSPLRFAGSVHNTASGMVALATDARGFTTSIAAGDETLVACLHEALGLLATGHDAVAVVVGDAAPPRGLIDAEEDVDTLAVAFVLRRAPSPAHLASGDAAPGLAELVALHPVPAPFSSATSSGPATPFGPAASSPAAASSLGSRGLRLDFQPCFSALQLLQVCAAVVANADASGPVQQVLGSPPGRADGAAWVVTLRPCAEIGTVRTAAVAEQLP